MYKPIYNEGPNHRYTMHNIQHPLFGGRRRQATGNLICIIFTQMYGMHMCICMSCILEVASCKKGAETQLSHCHRHRYAGDAHAHIAVHQKQYGTHTHNELAIIMCNYYFAVDVPCNRRKTMYSST